jgi:hypothetical protein
MRKHFAQFIQEPSMSNVEFLLSQKMALERMIEQARVEELEKQRRIEAERLSARNAEIASFRHSLKNLMKKYDLSEDQILRGQENISKAQTKSSELGKKMTLQEMRTFYANL